MGERRHELSEIQWQRIADLFPIGGGRGRPWRDHRQIVNGLFWKLNTGVPWRDLPERYGPWKTVYDRFRRWQREGRFERILQRLRLQLDELGRIDWEFWAVDSTNIRASRAAAGAKKTKSAPAIKRSGARAEAGGAKSIW
jgi:transposase